MRLRCRIAAGCVATVLCAYAQDTSPRERALQEKLVAACCWSESIAHHSSGKAGEMRLELHQMLEAGRSDEEILGAFQVKYGKRVLMEPDGGTRAVAYLIPVAGGVSGLSVVILVIRKWARQGQAATA